MTSVIRVPRSPHIVCGCAPGCSVNGGKEHLDSTANLSARHNEFKAELREIRERLDQLSADLAMLSTQVQDLAAEIRRFTSS